ncbi:metacaspase-3-like [Cynara cardunculus var. scolymus]|uniref:metacaspase-3-like n=1 Tax=Cynara cardunculus var. scolymus TaxID=59895 RepID=UPI000D62BF43|nr:metacaspase-3-like [Cynara cardunculus var. scolymus]
MATTTQHCKTCGRTLIKIPRSQYEMCPACQTVNLFNSKLKDCILTRLGQYVNAGTSQNQDALQGQPPQTKTSSQQTVPPAAVKVDRSYRILRPQLSRLTLSRIHQQTPQVHGKKRAVLCGVTYNGHKKKLEASVHNVRSMQQLLQNKLGFPSASIRVLTEEESDPSRIPTKCNIEEALRWLVQGCQSGDSLMFYYAGHGCKVVDEDGDETDGYDEALCPVDYREAGKIIDDEINATIVAPLPHGVTLHSVIDTCFSGTLLDLPFLCNINQDGLYMWEEHQLTNKGTSGGKALCISACADDQNSADTSAFTGNAVGALTFSFIQAMETESKLTYGRLLSSMRKKVCQAQQVVGRFAPFASSTSQEPQLSCSTRFEIYSEPVML